MVIQKAGNPAFCFIKKRWKEVKKLATKLKNLHIRKVDFVDEGANQRADIKIAKKKDADPEADIPVRESTMKKFMRAIGKAVGITDDYLDALEDVQKGNSQTFGEKMTEVKRQKVADEMWSICYALQSSLQSILYDEDLDGATAQSMMEKSVSEFDEIIGESISSWSAGKISGIKKDIGINDIESLKKFRDHLDENIEKQPEFNRAFGEKAVEVKSVISCLIVMLVIDAAIVIIIRITIPNFLDIIFTWISLSFHGSIQFLAYWLAPTVFSIFNPQSFIYYILP